MSRRPLHLAERNVLALIARGALSTSGKITAVQKAAIGLLFRRRLIAVRDFEIQDSRGMWTVTDAGRAELARDAARPPERVA